MSFKDLTVRAAAAMKLKRAETVTTPAKENDSKTADAKAPVKSKTL